MAVGDVEQVEHPAQPHALTEADVLLEPHVRHPDVVFAVRVRRFDEERRAGDKQTRRGRDRPGAREVAARCLGSATADEVEDIVRNEFRTRWPDPFLGLARTFIYGLDDVDRGASALAEAEKNGHTPSARETTQLADGYRARGETLWRTAQTLKDMPQERDYLTRAKESLDEALTRYSAVSGFGNAAIQIRETQRRLERVEARLSEISRRSWWPWD